MKILYIITKANWGGAQKYVYELATAAKAAGHEVVVAYGESGKLVEKLTVANIRTVALGGLERDMGIAREWRAFWELVRLIRKERPDIVHVNSSKASGLGTLAARVARVPRIVFTAHGWAWNEERPWWQKALIYKFAWLTILLSHTTICVSQAIRRDTRFMPFVRRKLVVIYSGVGAPAYEARNGARHALWPEHEDGIWIGMLSELHPTKRIEDAIEALFIVRTTHPDARLIVLGEGEERAKLEGLIKERGLAERARLAGFVPDADRYLKAFDLFLHASRSESLGLAVIEAGLAGLPVVATKVGGIPEIVKDGVTGFLTPPHAPAAIACALRNLVSDPARAREMGEALCAECRERFSDARMRRETLALYVS